MDDKSPNHMTIFNRFIIGWVYFLCFLYLCDTFTLLANEIAALKFMLNYNPSVVFIDNLNLMYKIVLPFKDLLIALSFSYLYYYQGMKMQEGKKYDENDKDVLNNIVSQNINDLMSEENEGVNKSFEYTGDEEDYEK